MITTNVNDTTHGSIVRVSIKTDDFYYSFGLILLIKELNIINKTSSYIIADDFLEEDSNMQNIIIRDSMISINLKRKNRRWKNDFSTECQKTIHIPFICRQNSLSDIMAKLQKILLIATMDYSSFISPEKQEMIGLKKFKQLSLTGCKILLLIGKGYNVGYISRMLNRSEKTISNHCRNSIRKLGVLNRVEFYKYAHFIALCGNKERSTLCL